MVVGIPRALFYYKYHVLWQSFFDELGVATVVSSPTVRSVMEAGLKACVGEACLPLKVYFGHVLSLRGKADCVFVPRYVSVHRHEYICPKFAGLPDMVRLALPDAPPVLEVEINHHSGDKDASLCAAVEVGRQLGYTSRQSKQAYIQAVRQYRTYRAAQVGGILENKEQADSPSDQPLILLLGHVYNVFDNAMNLNLIQHIQSLGADVMTAESIDGRLLRANCGIREEPLFWTLGVQMLGTAYEVLKQCHADGVIYLTSFGCGLDAFVENMVARRMHERNLPYMVLTMDEHTAEAGLMTRLEAFMETLEWRRNNDTDFSPYGQYDNPCQSPIG